MSARGMAQLRGAARAKSHRHCRFVTFDDLDADWSYCRSRYDDESLPAYYYVKR